MIAKKERFSDLRYPVHKLPVENQVGIEFPELYSYNEIKNYAHPHKNLIVRYMCMLYDPNTDLIKQFQNDFNQRRYAAASEAGIKKNGDKWPKWFELLLDFKKQRPVKKQDGKDDDGNPKYKTEQKIEVDEDLILMILRFIRIFKNRVWTEICTLEVELERLTKQRWEGLGVSDPQKAVQSAQLSTVCDNHIAKLNSYMNEFVNGDDGLKEEVLEMITSENAMRIMGGI